MSLLVAVSLPATSLAQAAPGDLDLAFSADGMATTDFDGGGDYGADVAIQADGRIVVAGGTGRDFALARYNADGSLDGSFDGDGKVTTDLGGGDGGADVAVQADGKIVVVGGSTGRFALARYDENGSLDPSFDGDGRQTTGFGDTAASANGVALQRDGKIVAVGQGGAGFALARYNADGSLDPSFDVDGKQTTEFADGAAAAVALQGDGKIVAVGRTSGEGMDLALARYNPDGSLDSSFDGDGKQTTAIPFNSDESLSDVAIQPDGRLVVVGTYSEFNICGCTDLVVGHYTADGSPAGLPLTSVSGTDSGAGVALQPDGKIVAAGSSLTDGQGDFVLARYDSVGSPDATFAGGGIQITDFGAIDGAGGVALQPDGKIVVVGQAVTATSTGGDFALARYQGGSVRGTAPANTTPPSITGNTVEAHTLTAVAGAWTGSTPIDRSYQWRRCDAAGAGCIEIAAATATTYILAAADVGHTIRVRETARNPHGQGSADSAATAVIRANPGGIAGSVQNAKNATKIANASVNCGNRYFAKTASNGQYSMANVASGAYTCTASANGYQSATNPTVAVAPGAITRANFNLTRT